MDKKAVETKEGVNMDRNEDRVEVTKFTTGGVPPIYLENMVGKTIGEVRHQLREVLNLTSDHKVVMVNGRRINDPDAYIIGQSEEIEFLKPMGQKG